MEAQSVLCVVNTPTIAQSALPPLCPSHACVAHQPEDTQMLRSLDVLTCTLFWYRLALQEPFALFATHPAFMTFTGASMAVTTLANLLPLRWCERPLLIVTSIIHHVLTGMRRTEK